MNDVPMTVVMHQAELVKADRKTYLDSIARHLLVVVEHIPNRHRAEAETAVGAIIRQMETMLDQLDFAHMRAIDLARLLGQQRDAALAALRDLEEKHEAVYEDAFFDALEGLEGQEAAYWRGHQAGFAAALDRIRQMQKDEAQWYEDRK